MRPDMAKVVTERPRFGHHSPSKKWGGRFTKDEIIGELSETREECGGFFPWGRKRNPHRKEFSDLLGPLVGYLLKQVGRSWDDVYSECSKVLDRRSLSGLHIWRHLLDYVDRNALVVDGMIYLNTAWRYYDESFYVDPTNGLLCVVFGKRNKYPPFPPTDGDIVKVDDLHYLMRKNGCWFLVTKEEVWDTRPKYEFVGGSYTQTGIEEFKVVIESKKQLSKKELKAVGLKNFPKGNSSYSRRDQARLNGSVL